MRNFFRNLNKTDDLSAKGQGEVGEGRKESEIRTECDGSKNDREWAHQGLGFLDMLITEEELAIQIAKVNCIEVDDMNFAKAGK